MAVALVRDELNLAQDLQKTGLERSTAVLAIVMATRAHARPEEELVEIVRQYPGLESPWESKRALRDLLRLKWLQTSNSYGVYLTHQAPDLREKIAKKLGDPSVADRLLAMRANLEPFVKVIGPMNDEVVYTTFLELLKGAQKEICLPMLATTPYEETVHILRERASAGVRVRILLGDPSLVAKWRGETMRKIAEERISQWVNAFKDRSTAEVRLSHSTEDMSLATCFSIDRETVRLDVYDPYTQRSLEGVMVEIVSPQGLSLNLIRIFQSLFDSAWSRAYSVGKYGRPRFILRRWWKVWVGLVIIGLAWAPIGLDHWPELAIGLGAGVITPWIIEDMPTFWSEFRRRAA